MKKYLGTWQIMPSDGFWTDQDKAESEKVISSAIHLGITGFDTAQSYGKGRSEQTLSKVLRRFADRKFTVDTKIMPSVKDASEILKPSMARLGSIGIDCLYLHWPRSGFDNAAQLKSMCLLREQGLVRKVGACNLPLELLKKFLAEGIEIDRIQRPLSLLWSRDWKEELSFCHGHGIEVCIYSPSGMGLLSGKYRDAEDIGDSRSSMFCFDTRCNSRYLELLDLVSSIAQRRKVPNTAVAIAWTSFQEPDIMLLGVRNVKQLEENLDDSVVLSETELSDLSQASEALSEASRSVCSNIFSYRW